VLLTAAAAFGQTPPPTPATPAAALQPSTSRDRKIVRRWALPGSPRGIAIGADGTIYAGLAESQAVVAIDPKAGTIVKRVVLDSADIASTKDLVTLRTSADRTRLFIANGSDESVTILSLPNLGVVREITMEGETIRDALPDPKGRYLYVLGRRVHVYDFEGRTELRTLDIAEPMAIAASANGSLLAVIAPEDFGNAKATMVVMFDTTGFAEVARDPLQTEKPVEQALFADGDEALLALARDTLFEKPLKAHTARAMTTDGNSGGRMRMKIDFGDLVSSNAVCLPNGSGPQIATLTTTDAMLVYAERRCSSSGGGFEGSNRTVTPASLYGIDAYAIAYDKATNTLAATDPAGFLTVYNVPRPAIAK
jgi:hypothetical protein